MPRFKPQETPEPFEKVIPPKVPVESPADTDRFAGFAVFAEIVID